MANNLRKFALWGLGALMIVSAVTVSFFLGTLRSGGAANAQEVAKLEELSSKLSAQVEQLFDSNRNDATLGDDDEEPEDAREVARKALARARKYGRGHRRHHGSRLTLRERLSLKRKALATAATATAKAMAERRGVGMRTRNPANIIGMVCDAASEGSGREPDPSRICVVQQLHGAAVQRGRGGVGAESPCPLPNPP